MYFSRRGEEAERRAAEVEAIAERLPLADDEVGALVARRLDHAERQRVGGADGQRAVLVRSVGEGLHVLDRAEEVRLLKDDRADVVAQRGAQRGEVGDAAVEADLDDLGPVADGERVERRAAVRVHAAADEHARALVGELGHVGGGADGARAVVDGGVGDRQAR